MYHAIMPSLGRQLGQGPALPNKESRAVSTLFWDRFTRLKRSSANEIQRARLDARELLDGLRSGTLISAALAPGQLGCRI